MGTNVNLSTLSWTMSLSDETPRNRSAHRSIMQPGKNSYHVTTPVGLACYMISNMAHA